jgi:hypothetical protein
MQMLKISLYDDSGNLVTECYSAANADGMHNYPTAEKEVPGLVELLITKINQK